MSKKFDYWRESYPFLIRVKTGEKIMIRKNDTYYLVDCGTTNRGSTNFTYLDDEQLQPMEEYALEDGMKIRLADEEFEFYLY